MHYSIHSNNERRDRQGNSYLSVGKCAISAPSEDNEFKMQSERIPQSDSNEGVEVSLEHNGNAAHRGRGDLQKMGSKVKHLCFSSQINQMWSTRQHHIGVKF